MEEMSVQRLISKCYCEGDRYYMLISSKTVRDKPVQVRPWRLSDMDHMPRPSSFLDPRRTVSLNNTTTQTHLTCKSTNYLADLHRRRSASDQSKRTGFCAGEQFRPSLLRWHRRGPGDEVPEGRSPSHLQHLKVLCGRHGRPLREHSAHGLHQARESPRRQT